MQIKRPKHSFRPMVKWFYSDTSLDTIMPVVLGLHLQGNHWLYPGGGEVSSVCFRVPYFFLAVAFCSPPACFLCGLLKSSVTKMEMFCFSQWDQLFHLHPKSWGLCLFNPCFLYLEFSNWKLYSPFFSFIM